MATVTNARVLFRRVVQPVEYETATAEVEYSFSFTEDEAHLAHEVTQDLLDVAKDQVLKAVGLRKKDKDKAPPRRLRA